MAETRWLDAEEQQAWRAYLDTTRLLLPALDRQLQADAGISLHRLRRARVELSEAPGRRMRMRDLAEATLSTPSAATRAVTRCEQAGWVRRVECEDDRRGMHAQLTRAGAAKLAAAAPGHVGRRPRSRVRPADAAPRSGSCAPSTPRSPSASDGQPESA